jgi:hypothetical protein
MKTLSSQYAEFTPEERLRLTVIAEARGDQTEVERLMRSCPQKPLVVPDPEFFRRLLWMRAAVNERIRLWVEISALVLSTVLLLGGRSRKDRADVATGTAAWKEWSAIWRGIEAGITTFCAETGLTVEQLLALAGGGSPLIEGARGGLHPDAPADRGCEDGTLRLLRQAWQGGRE